VSNAIKFTPPEGRIEVRARREPGGGVVIEVRDNGPGIAPDELEHVMRPFCRGREAEADTSGTGLGLPLARALTQALGGQLRLTSGFGQGTTARLDLPI
jgi:signal transduction histidine kinase